MTTITLDDLTALAEADSSLRDLIARSDSSEHLRAGLSERGLSLSAVGVPRPDYSAGLHPDDFLNAGTSYAQNCPTYRTCGASHPCKQTC